MQASKLHLEVAMQDTQRAHQQCGDLRLPSNLRRLKKPRPLPTLGNAGASSRRLVRLLWIFSGLKP